MANARMHDFPNANALEGAINPMQSDKGKRLADLGGLPDGQMHIQRKA